MKTARGSLTEPRAVLLAAGILVAAAPSAVAQARVPPWLSAQGTLTATHVDPIPGSGALTEARVVQPVVMARPAVLGGRLAVHATLDLEGLTIPHGVLTLGAWGEGFIDRRHPHTYAHELMLSGVDLLGHLDGPASVSLSVGKGFVPFGSDDPMSRPAIAYPVNHHWSQILERAIVMTGVRTGPVRLEAALFNGDEPERPSQWPRLAQRFGDSRAARLTLSPLPWLDMEVSAASVKSPEHRPGAGTVQNKWHASVRAERALGPGRGYALAEWARTTEASGFFRFTSVLGEAAWAHGGSRGYYRFEHTDRPEESRTINLFRSLRPHLENSILGTTVWAVHTLGAGRAVSPGYVPVRLEAIIEGSYATVDNLTGGIFQPEAFYGRRTLWALTLALRVSAGTQHRMGRYGAGAMPGPMPAGMHGGAP